MDELLAALMLWIGSNSAYSTDSMPLPAVVLATPEELTAEYYADAPRLAPTNGIDERVLALYAFDDGPYGTVYALDCRHEGSFSHVLSTCDEPQFQERLLHELVHHVQRLSGAYERLPCRAAGEKEAYRLGGRFLAARHATDPLPNREFWAHVYSRC